MHLRDFSKDTMIGIIRCCNYTDLGQCVNKINPPPLINKNIIMYYLFKWYQLNLTKLFLFN